jgi:predicted RNase H-like HicB family nuclease
MESTVRKAAFTYWLAEDGKYLGYLNEFPDHWTQGDNLEDLKAHLADLFEMFTSEDVPGIKRVSELEVA